MGGEGCAVLGKFANITEREREREGNYCNLPDTLRPTFATSRQRTERGQREVRAEKII